MDKRKPIGRTALDLEMIFYELPEATFCLDLAHARQVDPTMGEARAMIIKFGDRLTQLHLSIVNFKSRHEPLNVEALLSYKKLNHLIDSEIPIILESPVESWEIKNEIQKAGYLFDTDAFEKLFERAAIPMNNVQ